MYIRQVTISPIAAIIGCIIACLCIAAYIVQFKAEHAATCFVSDILPKEHINKHLKRDKLHFVDCHPSIISLLLFGTAFLLAILNLFVSFAHYKANEAGIIAVMSGIVIWFTGIHTGVYLIDSPMWHVYEKPLRVVEKCRCISDPSKAVLLLKDRSNKMYTYEIPVAEYWKLGQMHTAYLKGCVVTEVNPSKYKAPEEMELLTTHCTWYSLAAPIFALMLTAFFFGVWYSSYLDYVFYMMVSCAVVAIYYLPLPRLHTLQCIRVIRSDRVADIEPLFDYTLVMISKSGNIYYYQTDDAEFVEDRTYKCVCYGNRVSTLRKEVKAFRTPKVKNIKLGDGWIVIIVMYALSMIAYLCSIVPLCILFIILPTGLIAGLLRHTRKGEVYGQFVICIHNSSDSSELCDEHPNNLLYSQAHKEAENGNV